MFDNAVQINASIVDHSAAFRPFCTGHSWMIALVTRSAATSASTSLAR
jgi:hypothetical protein